MGKRKSRGSRETSMLLEQMGIGAEDEAPAEPEVLPEAAVLPKTTVSPKAVASPTASPSSPSPAKPRSRALLWVLIVTLVAAAGGVAAWLFLSGARP